jgi:hypothetical protein
MGIVEDHALVYYGRPRLVIEINDVGDLELHSNVDVYNAAGQRRGTDHPTPQATPAQLALFQTWLDDNLDDYATATGLIPLPP